MAVNLDKIRKKLEELKKKSRGGSDWMQLEDGDNLVRFRSNDDGDFYFETGYHYVKQGKDKVSVVCNELHDGTECYICDVVAELYKSKDKGDKALAKELSAKPRVFFCVVDREDGKTKLLATGNSIFKDLLKYFADEDWGDLTHPVDGRDVVITKTGTGLDTEYTVMPKPKTSKLGVDDDFLDLDVATPFTVEEQEMVMNGVTTEEIFKLRDSADGDADKKKETKEKEKTSTKVQPKRKPKSADGPEEVFADKIAMIDMDIPKAVKMYNAWLSDDDRTEEELDAIVEKYPKEEEAEKEDDTNEEGGEDTVDDEVQKALAKFKKNQKK